MLGYVDLLLLGANGQAFTICPPQPRPAAASPLRTRLEGLRLGSPSGASHNVVVGVVEGWCKCGSGLG